MKRKYTAFLFLALTAATVLSAKTKIKIKNTVGADSDEIADYDLYTRTSETDYSGNTQTNSGFSLGDQFQLDLESDYVNGRFRLEAVYQNVDSSTAKMIFAPSGFVHFTPIQQFGIAFGNNFSKYFAIPSAYLAASDDTTKYGRLLTDSLGEERYFGNDSVAIFSNGFAGGITSDWNYGNMYAKVAAGGTFYPDTDEFEKAIDAGINAGLYNLFDIGFTAHDMTEATRKFGAFAGYTGMENLILNLGFYYNFTTSDYLPEERVERSNAWEYKKQSTKYALGLSAGYKFQEKGIGIYGDLISGLTNEYIGKIKYYDEDGNLVQTDITTIVRGSTYVKYKDGTAKRTDEYTHEGIPLYAQIRLTYQITPSVEALFNFKYRTLLRASDTNWITLYPRFKFDLPDEYGSIGAGIRFDMNAARYDGLSGISFPLTYTYKFKKKF
ncbi:MAG: hypothetical protein K5873_10735 [Treponema sp.]|nr:hypothetical protein [Treponema sp.]